MRILDAFSDKETGPEVSASFRRPTPGPEYELLMEFVGKSLSSPSEHERLAVFIEPRLETGCPDAVAVYWRATEGADLDVLRRLRPADDRLLQLIWLEQGIDAANLETRFGRPVARRAHELVALGLVCDEGYGMSVPDEGLVLSRLIAIEAKIAAPSSALRQAARNMWYASESYVLMPNLPTTQALCERYASCGVGIVTADEQIDQSSIPARRMGLPQSHVTWRFNRMALELCASGAA